MKLTRGAFVYVLTTASHTALYTGITTDLPGRLTQHREGIFPGSFTSRYHCTKLVYYAFYNRVEEAIAEEKRIKGGSRKQKLRLIAAMNPEWQDLTEAVFGWG